MPLIDGCIRSTTLRMVLRTAWCAARAGAIASPMPIMPTTPLATVKACATSPAPAELRAISAVESMPATLLVMIDAAIAICPEVTLTTAPVVVRAAATPSLPSAAAPVTARAYRAP